MSGPIRSNPNARTPNPPPPGAGQPRPPAGAAGTGRGLAGPPELGRAPSRQGLGAGESSASASARRASLPSSSRAGSSRGPTAPTATPTPSPSVRLGELAQRLAKLEQDRASLAARLDEAKLARQKVAGNSGSAESRAAIRRLQDRLERANEQVHRLKVARSEKLGRLERTERLLASCERSLEALSLDDAPAPATRTPAAPSTTPLTAAEARPVETKPRISPEELAAQQRVQQLSEIVKRATAELERAKQALADARRDVAKAEAVTVLVTRADTYMPSVDREAGAGLDRYLEAVGLPPAARPPERGADPRFDAYLDHFTELAADGTRSLRSEFQEPREAFAAFSALHGSMRDNAYAQSLLNRLLPEDVSAISLDLAAGGTNLEAIVRPMVIATFGHEMHMSLGLVEAADRTRNARLPRRSRLEGGSSITRQQVMAVAERNRVLLQLQQSPMHRASILDGAVHQICLLLRGVVLPSRAQAQEELAGAKARLEEAKSSQRPAFQRSVDAQRELKAAEEERDRLAQERREREAAAPRTAPAAAKISEAAIPQLEVASSSSGDAEARQLKLRGDVLLHTEQAEKSRQAIAQSDEQISRAEAEKRKIEDELESAVTEQAREAEGRQRQLGEQREEVGQLRRELDQLDAEIARARGELDAAPSRRSLVSDRAWERAIERHLDPSDDEMRIRAKATGYTGVYSSRTELAQAAIDIHDSLSERPEFQAVFAARTRGEFERAAAALPGGATDLVHDHGRPVGRGFSNDPDQTERATTLTQSSFSLQFVQGRVVISHLYPYVPHRQLTTGV